MSKSTSSLPPDVDREVITLNRNGIWLADGQEITHEPTRRLFAQSLTKDAEGYLIVVGRESKRIVVEDTAYFIHRIEGDPQSGYELWLSDESKVSLDPGLLKYRPGRLSCEVMTRLGPEEALFLRVPYFELLTYLQEDEQSYFLNFGGSRVDLAKK